MTNYTSVNVQQVQQILEKYGTTFERPVDLNAFVKEIQSCCVNISTNKSDSLEVSFSNAN
jgi:hypothetical protein